MNNPKNSELPAFMIADLYKNNLVITENEVVTREKPDPESLKTDPGRQWFLGSNLRKTTLLVNEPNAVYLDDDSLQFLSAILNACKLNLGDVAIVNLAQTTADYTLLKQSLQPANLILFGVTAQDIQLPFTIPHYQLQAYDKCQLLLCPPLTTMLGNTQEAKLEKSKLWLSLKKMFNV